MPQFFPTQKGVLTTKFFCRGRRGCFSPPTRAPPDGRLFFGPPPLSPKHTAFMAPCSQKWPHFGHMWVLFGAPWGLPPPLKGLWYYAFRPFYLWSPLVKRTPRPWENPWFCLFRLSNLRLWAFTIWVNEQLNLLLWLQCYPNSATILFPNSFITVSKWYIVTFFSSTAKSYI